MQHIFDTLRMSCWIP